MYQTYRQLTYDNIHIQCDNIVEVKYEKHKCNASSYTYQKRQQGRNDFLYISESQLGSSYVSFGSEVMCTRFNTG